MLRRRHGRQLAGRAAEQGDPTRPAQAAPLAKRVPPPSIHTSSCCCVQECRGAACTPCSLARARPAPPILKPAPIIAEGATPCGPPPFPSRRCSFLNSCIRIACGAAQPLLFSALLLAFQPASQPAQLLLQILMLWKHGRWQERNACLGWNRWVPDATYHGSPWAVQGDKMLCYRGRESAAMVHATSEMCTCTSGSG